MLADARDRRWNVSMNETEILIQTMRLNSSSERDAFLARECRGDPNKLATIRRMLGLESHLKQKFASIDDANLPKYVEELLSAPDKPLSSAADEATLVLPTDGAAEADPRPQKTADGKSATNENVTIAGRYVLQNKIGEGGMGEVWAAKQIAPLKRTVALKLIKRGMDSQAVIARFEQERQALALMDHPNIARVLDGGVTETGQSFFVMELVDGLPLTKFADESKLNTAERLELFVAVCQAVQHAHQKGIIHRDLKPANIMVTMIDGRPVPKVIDFGVAKATAGNLTDLSIAIRCRDWNAGVHVSGAGWVGRCRH
jgi:eukaryotic-like serine/threonine-protein kinase